MMIDGRFRSEPEINSYISEIKAEREKAKDTLRAALEDLEPRGKSCTVCKHLNGGSGGQACESCIMASNFEWRYHDDAQEIINKKERYR